MSFRVAKSVKILNQVFLSPRGAFWYYRVKRQKKVKFNKHNQQKGKATKKLITVIAFVLCGATYGEKSGGPLKVVRTAVVKPIVTANVAPRPRGAPRDPQPVGMDLQTDRLTRRILAPREVVDLQGDWSITWGKSLKVRVETNQVKSVGGRFRQVPRNLFSHQAPKDDAEWFGVKAPYVEGENSQRNLWMRKSVVLPKLNGRRVLVRFENIQESVDLFVNGKVWRHPEPTYGLEIVYDITDAVREGANEILLNFYTCHWLESEYLSRRSTERGLKGPAQVEIVNEAYVEDVFVKTFVVGGKRIEAEVSVRNAGCRLVDLEIKGEIASLHGKAMKAVEPVAATIEAGATKRVLLKGEWDDAPLWNPDEPNLLYFDVKIGVRDRRPALEADAFRTRFGWREFSIRGHRFMLNGFPFVARAGWALTGRTDEEQRDALKQFKKRGFNAMRLFVGQNACAQILDAADEIGVLSMVGGCTENGGGGYDTRVQEDGYNEVFWRNYDELNQLFVKTFRNNPGVIVWSLGCEFGAIYCGQGSPREKWTSKLICESGEKVMKLDPTRTWCENGGVEVGCPVKGRGPCPTRSFHYPVGLNTDDAAFPDVAYWYPDGVVSWHKIADFKKPTVITEDCYHGMQDSLRCMTRFGDDAVYTPEGYVKALRYGFNMFAEGYYLGGLAWWEPWMPFANIADNDLFGDYEKPSQENGMKGAYHDPVWQCVPEWMVAMRPFFTTVQGGVKDERTLYVYNQTFTRYDLELLRTDFIDGKEFAKATKRLSLDPGAKMETRIELNPPEVRKAETYTVAYELRAADRLLTTRRFDFVVFPKEAGFGNLKRFALLAETNSPLVRLRKSFGSYATDASKLFGGKSRFDAIVVDKSLTVKEGKALDGFVQGGGRVLLIDVKEGAWSPIEPLFHKPVRRVWRRQARSMTAFPADALACWRSDDAVSTSCFPKNGDEDTLVVEDCGLADGLSAYVTGWMHRGKGAYLLSQVPVSVKWDIEPAAKHYFAALIQEMGSPRVSGMERRFATWKCESTNEHISVDSDILQRAKFKWRHVKTTGPSYKSIFAESGIHEGTFTNALDEADVVVMDASCGVTREMIADADRVLRRRDTTVILMEIPEDSDRTLMYELGCRLKGTRKWKRDESGDYLPDTGPHAMGEFPYWTRPRQKGAFAGLTADDFLWYREDEVSIVMDQSMIKRESRIRIPHDDSMMTAEIVPMREVLRNGQVLCDPCAAVAIRRGQGTLILSTIRFRSFFGRYARRERFVLRTLLNNLDCATSAAGKVYEEEPLDISKSFNRNLWRDPLYRKADGTWEPEAWFGDDNDFRYFPVNLCGWSTAANNFCPKGAFPKQPMLLAGNRFLVQDPEKNGGKAVVHFAKDEQRRVAFDHPVTAHRFRLLLTATHGGEAAKIDLSINGKTATINGRDHFSVRWWACSCPKGKVAWAGETPKDPNGAIYSCLVDNPNPKKAVSEIIFSNRIPGGEFVLLSITAEREAE